MKYLISLGHGLLAIVLLLALATGFMGILVVMASSVYLFIGIPVVIMWVSLSMAYYNQNYPDYHNNMKPPEDL